MATSRFAAYHSPMTDLGALYRAARGRITALVTADGVDPDAPVAATPGWTVHDVVAHLSGVSVDAATGNMAGAPGEEWTGAQIQRGAGVPIADLIATWDEYAPLVEAFLSGEGGGMAAPAVLDVHTHEADLRTALGLPLEVPDELLEWAGPWLRDTFAQRVADEGLPPVTVDASVTEWFRARFGRRTEAEVRAWPWSADPSPYLDSFFIFGRAAQSLGERA